MGGFLGVGPRVTTAGHSLRFTFSLSPGLSIRQFTLSRNASVGGALDKFSASASRTSFALTGDASVLIGSGPGFKIMAGIFAWVDLGGATTTQGADPDVLTVPVGNTTIDVNIKNPPYTVQRGT